MKTIFKFIIVVLLSIVLFKTYNKTQSNNNGFWYNFGESSKEVVIDVIQHVKPIYESFKNGFKSSI